MTPYRFAFLRILCGLFLFSFFTTSITSEDWSVYWGLILLSILFTFGVSRQIVACFLLLGSASLFYLTQALLSAQFALLFLLILPFSLNKTNEPWLGQTPKNPKLWKKNFFEPFFLNCLIVFVFLLLIKSHLLTFSSLRNWPISVSLFLLLLYVFPASLFQAKRRFENNPIVFFDGVCGLCSQFVEFIFIEDQKSVIKVATLQGETARARLPIELTKELRSVIFIDGEVILKKSEAVLNVLYEIGGFWRLLFVLRILPRPMCDLAYDLVAKFRYRIFGINQSCRLPTPEEKIRFLD